MLGESDYERSVAGVLAELDQQVAEESELELQVFLGYFIRWIRKQLESADGIEIIGNL
ncbi:hypothetical protein [Paenibacillus sp. QZ-Y1]|uniref:hypothetical protein n=1 Tax=Paenibacillus sp. QZ-Y1 TaxID=3414511 RepID=UPI003F7B2F05